MVENIKRGALSKEETARVFNNLVFRSVKICFSDETKLEGFLWRSDAKAERPGVYEYYIRPNGAPSMLLNDRLIALIASVVPIATVATAV